MNNKMKNFIEFIVTLIFGVIALFGPFFFFLI